MKKLIIVSNRLPVTVKQVENEFEYFPSAGGLATGLKSVEANLQQTWMGWPGLFPEKDEIRDKIKRDFEAQGMVPVFLSEKELDLYYAGFSNKTIWPHFHYFTQYTTYNEAYWDEYVKVNQLFADVLIDRLQGDELVWIHDYHLMLLPNLIRKAFPTISIGFFLHIPFPSYEIFRELPWRMELMDGILGADLIGFHTFGYMRHFLSAAYRLGGYEHDLGVINLHSRMVHADVFPMGIDYEKFAFPNIENKSQIFQLRKHQFNLEKIILSVDRLDYSKGIPERIKVFEQFLKENKEYHGKVYLILVAVPSRTQVGHYQELKEEIETLIGRINGEYANYSWTPIKYFYRQLGFEELVQLYQASDIALITPLRDGMNLIAKEYVASKQDGLGVLILSEMAGASIELTEAITVNPHNQDEIVNAILTALEMPRQEQKNRFRTMQKIVKLNNVQNWANTFIEELVKISDMNKSAQIKLFDKDLQDKAFVDYQEANDRLLFLDYDGTLMGFNKDPEAVFPDEELLSLLERLLKDTKNKVVLISGRDRNTLEGWFGHFDIDISAEHGVWTRINGRWEKSLDVIDSWKEKVRPVLENMVKRTPGTFIEEKQYSLVWHYRGIDKELGEKRIREFKDVLLYLTANLDLQVLEGNKVVEVKNAGVNKGKSAMKWLVSNKWDFILAMGDDHTDEDTFKAMPPYSFSIKVGMDVSNARYHLKTVSDVRKFLGLLTT